jgi:UDP:flavonoid glycosyltransferase YjiC (YdhE family)
MGKRLFYTIQDHILNRYLKPLLNLLRGEVGLRPIEDVYRWIYSERSSKLFIGLWPDWYAPRQEDWPNSIVLAGFPNYDGSEDKPSSWKPENLAQKPIAVTAGTGVLDGQEFFSNAVKACVLLERPAYLLTRYKRQIPASLPNGISHIDYAPLSELLPSCAAILHHGGIGTISQAFLAGTPQLIVPRVGDQFDASRRLERLGASVFTRRTDIPAKALAKLVAHIIESPTIQRNTSYLKTLVDPHDSRKRICKHLTQLTEH